MKSLKRIIVGHDLRTGGEIALQSALRLAEWSGAEIKVVHVIEPHPLYEKLSHPLSSHGVPVMIAQTAGRKLEEIVSKTGSLRDQIRYEVCVGKPFVELVVARRAWRADLVIVGGAATQNDYSLGSTAGHVIRKAAVPVLVTKRPFKPELKSILVPVDFSSGSKEAAVEAISLAQHFEAQIIFFHVIDLYPLLVSGYGEEINGMIPEIPAKVLAPDWDPFIATLPLERVSWIERTEEGSTASTIVQRAEIDNADLIVMGTHGRTGLNYVLLGSVAERVVRGAPCPVLMIKPGGFEFSLP